MPPSVSEASESQVKPPVPVIAPVSVVPASAPSIANWLAPTVEKVWIVYPAARPEPVVIEPPVASGLPA